MSSKQYFIYCPSPLKYNWFSQQWFMHCVWPYCCDGHSLIHNLIPAIDFRHVEIRMDECLTQRLEYRRILFYIIFAIICLDNSIIQAWSSWFTSQATKFIKRCKHNNHCFLHPHFNLFADFSIFVEHWCFLHPHFNLFVDFSIFVEHWWFYTHISISSQTFLFF